MEQNAEFGIIFSEDFMKKIEDRGIDLDKEIPISDEEGYAYLADIEEVIARDEYTDKYTDEFNNDNRVSAGGTMFRTTDYSYIVHTYFEKIINGHLSRYTEEWFVIIVEDE